MERVLKLAILRRGLPGAIYVDNGLVYASTQFGAALATLGRFGERELHKQVTLFASSLLYTVPLLQAKTGYAVILSHLLKHRSFFSAFFGSKWTTQMKKATSRQLYCTRDFSS